MYQALSFGLLISMHAVFLSYAFVVIVSRRKKTPAQPVVVNNNPSGRVFCRPRNKQPQSLDTVLVTEVLGDLSSLELKKVICGNPLLYRLVIHFIHDNKKLVQPYGLARFIEKDIHKFKNNGIPVCELDIFQLTVDTDQTLDLGTKNQFQNQIRNPFGVG